MSGRERVVNRAFRKSLSRSAITATMQYVTTPHRVLARWVCLVCNVGMEPALPPGLLIISRAQGNQLID